MAEQDKKKEGPKKISSAKKRHRQSEDNRLRNRTFRSAVQTATRAYREAAEKKEAPEALQAKLRTIQSLMDKGVKKGVYNANKAARTKSRLAANAR